MDEEEGFYASRHKYHDLLDWLADSTPDGQFPLCFEEVAFVASYAELAGGQDSGDEEDRALVERLLAEYEEAHQHTEHGNVQGRKEFACVEQETQAILKARFGARIGEQVFDTIDGHMVARENLVVRTREEPEDVRTREELMVIADRLRELLPEIYSNLMSTLLVRP